jgi:glycosyltransferase involved in cell wall biosynthesis
MKIVGIMLVRNEANRYLEKVISKVKEACDYLIVLDDASEDNTLEICKLYADEIYMSDKPIFKENELHLRKLSWEYATRHCHHDDWIVCLDADEELTQTNLREKMELAKEHDLQGLSFKLYDMWNETQYREDEIWNAHEKPWLRAIRYDANKKYTWKESKLHCGMFPNNSCERALNAKIDILHWGWSKQGDRIKKYKFYKETDTNNDGINEQYESILDVDVMLKTYKRKKILIAAPVRQDEETFVRYLDSLKELHVDDDILVEYFFLLHNSKELAKYLEPHQYALVDTTSDYIINETHNWTNRNLIEVAQMKNHIVQNFLGRKFDYLFLVDSDILLHKETLMHLMKQNKDVIAEIFWTRWKPEEPEMPNAWLFDFYGFDSNAFLTDWREKGVYLVGGTGACILISKEVFEVGVNYSPIPNISWTQWEDRAFCIKAVVHGFEIYLDTHYPATHLYRKGEN